jgi:hypothetical protein
MADQYQRSMVATEGSRTRMNTALSERKKPGSESERLSHFLARAEISNQVYILEFFTHPPTPGNLV